MGVLLLVRVLFFSLVACSIGWVFLVIATQLAIVIMKYLMGISIGFRIARFNCIKDVSIQFKKGDVESISIGEIKLVLKESLLDLGLILSSGNPIIELVISDISVAMRPKSPTQSTRKKKSKPPSKKKPGSGGGKGKKLMMLANAARFLSVSVFNVSFKTPKAAVGVKELKIGLTKCEGFDHSYKFKLQVMPILVHMLPPEALLCQSINFSHVDQIVNGQTCSNSVICDDFLIRCEFGNYKHKGVKIRELDVEFGDITVNVNESLLANKKPAATTGPSNSQDAPPKTLKSDKKSSGVQSKVASLKKQIAYFPEKVSLNMRKLDARFTHQVSPLLVQNSINGISLTVTKSPSMHDLGEDSSRLGLQLDFSEIHLLRDSSSSVLEISRVAASATFDIPNKDMAPIRAEADVKFGRTQCNLMISRLAPLVALCPAKKPKPTMPHEESSNISLSTHQGGTKDTEQKAKPIIWNATASVPGITVVLFKIDGSSPFHVCFQSSLVSANNFAQSGTQLHGELGELNMSTPYSYHYNSEKCLDDIENDSVSVLQISKIAFEIGKKEETKFDEAVTSLNISGLDANLSFQPLEDILVMMASIKALIKAVSSSRKQSVQNKSAHRSTQISTDTEKANKITKVSLARCVVRYFGEMDLQDMTVTDPKRVNYGSQGGKVLVTACPDGTPRTANIFATGPSNCSKIKFCTSLEIINLGVYMNKEKHSTEIDLESAKSVFKDFPDGQTSGSSVILLDMQKAKLVRRSGGLSDGSSCSLFTVTDILVRWEPDMHLALFEVATKLKAVMHKIKTQNSDPEPKEEPGKIESSNDKEAIKKKESIFAIDVEKLNIMAEVADGVEATIHVQSIFSENTKIGVLFEGLQLRFNGARIFKTSRTQVSRIPVTTSSHHMPDGKLHHVTVCDWVIQAGDMHVCMPYRLELRAIDDAVEDTIRCLKLISTAKTNLFFPEKISITKKTKPKTRSTKIRYVRLIVHELLGEIEEEPLQGWLDEHYHLLKREIAEATSRLNLLESIMNTDNNAEPKTPSIQSLREEIYKHTFASYYRACKDLPVSDGSGAFSTGFQSGFKLSKNRTSVLSVRVKQVDLSMSAIEGGEEGMIAFIKSVDEHCAKNEVPFGKFYGCNLSLKAGLLVARLRDYTHPLLLATSGKCDGCVVLAQQATYFQPQMLQDVFVGKWWKVRLYRSMSGTTPPMKFYSRLPIHFQKGEVSFGVGYEPVLADVSYAFSVALRRSVLGKRTSPINTPLPKKEKSLPWWDDMRNYIHGINSLYFSEAHWHLLASIDPYEKMEKIDIISRNMEIQQRDGQVSLAVRDLEVHLSSLDSLVKNSRLELPPCRDVPFLRAPSLFFEINMEWQCESRDPMNHFLFSFPAEGKTREKVLDPFRSTSLSLQWSFTLTPLVESTDMVTPLDALVNSPTINMAAHDLSWLLKWWNMMYLPPQKLRMFSRWPRFGVPRIPRSGNLALDRVMTENFIRFTSTPTVVNYLPLRDDDPAYGMNFKVANLKYEMCFSRGKHQEYMFDTKRETMDLIYQGLNLEVLKANIGTNSDAYQPEKSRDEGFLLSSSYITIRRQAPKADPVRLLSWQEDGRKNIKLQPVFSHGSESDNAHSDLSDDDGFNILVADNCQRIFVYDLKLLWNLENREAVWSWVAGISKAFQAPKLSPSRLYTQRKLAERREKEKVMESMDSDLSCNDDAAEASDGAVQLPQEHVENVELLSSNSSSKVDVPSSSTPARQGTNMETEEQETKHFIVNFSQPQFNLHSEEHNARFLLAAASGKVLARSFHAILHIGYQMIAGSLTGITENDTNNDSGSNNSNITTPTTITNTTTAAAKEVTPEMTWRRAELSVMLEHVQAHVAPTDVDPGAGLQWLPKIKKEMPELKRTGPLLERVFMPCQMYLRYTRHKSGPQLKSFKPLKELTFNSPSIAAAMTSRQFQTMMDVLTNLLLARSPKAHNNSMVYPSDEDGNDENEEIGEEANEVVPDGVEEVEQAKIRLEQRERETKVLIDDIRSLLSQTADSSGYVSPALQSDDKSSWIVTGSRSLLAKKLKTELVNTQSLRREACSDLRSTMRTAVQLRLTEKEKSKSPSYAMRISMKIEKVVWSMLIDGRPFAETEINDMVYDFDRDFRDKGISNFTTKSVVVKNCVANAKSDMLLSAWNPPLEWGKNVMVRVNSKQGVPKDGRSPIESFRVDIYPLKIHLTESMYRMMWDYFFPGEEQHSQKRQEVWKVSTIAGSRRVKKGTSVSESSDVNQQSITEFSTRGDISHAKKSQQRKGNSALLGSKPELRRTSSFDQSSWEETVAESVANEIVLQAQKPKIAPTKSEPVGIIADVKDSKRVQTSRATREEKKAGKVQEEKQTQHRKMTEFQSFNISQVELLLTYEGSLPINNLRLLMDTFHRENFTGTWSRLFGRVKKHIIVGVVKSVMGIQVKKFKDKSGSNQVPSAVISAALSSGDSDDEQGGFDQIMANWVKSQQSEGAGDGFVSSVKGLFTSQKKKAKQFVLRTMRNDSDQDLRSGKLSDGEVEISPFARQLTIHKARKLIKQHTKKYSRSTANQDASIDVDSGNENEDDLAQPCESMGYEGDTDNEPFSEDKS